MLLLAWFDPSGLGTIRENVENIQRLSRHRVDVLNLFASPPSGPIGIPPHVGLWPYSAVFIHCTLSFDPQNLVNLDRRHPEKLADYQGLKIVMKQDEHFRVNALVDFLRAAKVQLLLTCLAPEWVRKVYPEAQLPDLQFLHARTGYVTPHMRSLPFTQADDRPIDVGYRGSPQPLYFGRLCYQKREIGEAFQRICVRRGLKADISSRWEDRFFGDEWWKFLGRCKATLGVESGASVFDFTGEIERHCEQYLAKHPDADFETLHRKFLAPHEGNVYYNQVSPRHFEAAACRTVQILYEGRYSGIFQPGRHYLPLKHDKSNVDEVLQRLADPAQRKQMTEAAFDEIIMNDEYLYSAFVAQLDEAIDSQLARLGGQARSRWHRAKAG